MVHHSLHSLHAVSKNYQGGVGATFTSHLLQLQSFLVLDVFCKYFFLLMVLLMVPLMVLMILMVLLLLLMVLQFLLQAGLGCPMPMMQRVVWVAAACSMQWLMVRVVPLQQKILGRKSWLSPFR